jgi:lipoprotein-anchoring transpeptidase ErfK/SrfK
MVTLAGCGSSPAPKSTALPGAPASSTAAASTAPTPTDAPTTVPAHRYQIAFANGASIGIYDSPVQTEPTRSLPSPDIYGNTLVFVVKDQKPDWVKVLLPLRPNGSTGWVRASDVTVQGHDFHIEVQVGAHKLTVFQGSDVVLEETVAVGASATPTALGSFYTTGLVESHQAAYGPYAYPLSGYSEVLYEFGGGEGQMGIHGTNDPSSLGRSVSNGCIRMSNAAITKLANMLPAGVPVDITA